MNDALPPYYTVQGSVIGGRFFVRRTDVFDQQDWQVCRDEGLRSPAAENIRYLPPPWTLPPPNIIIVDIHPRS